MAKAKRWKSLKSGKEKWTLSMDVDLTEDFCLIGCVDPRSASWAAWISPLSIGGKNRIKCDFFKVLSLIGPVENFVLDRFKTTNQGFFYFVDNIINIISSSNKITQVTRSKWKLLFWSGYAWLASVSSSFDYVWC